MDEEPDLSLRLGYCDPCSGSAPVTVAAAALAVVAAVRPAFVWPGRSFRTLVGRLQQFQNRWLDIDRLPQQGHTALSVPGELLSFNDVPDG